VYQYELSSFRQNRGRDGTYEYVFLVNGGRGRLQPVSILLKTSVIQEWQIQLGRESNASERYAIAKIALKRHLDETETPGAIGSSVSPGVVEVDAISSFLGL
jgi:hypothetical protein